MNITDPDSRNLKCRRGHKQGYNAQAVVTEDQIVIAAELNTDSPDFGHQRSARSRSVHRRRAGSCSGRSSTAMSSGGTRRPPFRARGRPRRWVLLDPSLRPAAAWDEEELRRGAGRDSCICPAERKTARRHGPPCRSPRYEQSGCPRSLSACKHPNSNAVRKRSEALPRLGAGDGHTGGRRPRRGAASS